MVKLPEIVLRGSPAGQQDGLHSFPDMTTDQQQDIQEYADSQVIDQLAANHRTQEANATQARADEERRRTQPQEHYFRGSDDLPIDRLMEGLTRVFNGMQGNRSSR